MNERNFFSEEQAAARIASMVRKMVKEEPLAPGEEVAFIEWLTENPTAQEVYKEVRDPASFEKWLELNGYFRSIKASVLEHIKEQAEPRRHSIIRQILTLGAAAAILVAIATAFLFKFSAHPALTPGIAKVKDIAPGTSKAILTLANGSKIVLDNLQNGLIARQGMASVEKLHNDQLAYTSGGDVTEIQYNTLTTPLGGQYHLVLPDGTSVFLNAGSSLRYPINFAGAKQREVALAGEAYFEVKKNPSVPFIVKVNDVAVKVLGTRFNIMAYNNEPDIETTLVDGSIQVNTTDQSKILVPNQQAKLTKSNILSVIPVDASDYVAWKNGLIQLHDAGIPAVMRQISRWYDVQVAYEGTKIPNWTLAGAVPRSLNLTDVLKVLDLNGIHTHIEGRKVTVVLKD